MTYKTPTTGEIRDGIIAQIEAPFGPLMPKSFTYVLATVLAGVFILLYKYCEFMGRQMFVGTATLTETEINGKTVSPLREWGRLTGAGDPFTATQAELTISVSAEIIGAQLPAYTQFVHAPSGVVYLNTEGYILSAESNAVIVRAVSDPSGGGGAGTVGNLPEGAVLTLVSPLTGVASSATVSAQYVTGAEAETAEAYRQRILSRFQQRPQGGAYVDYKLWAEGVEGVAQAYPYAGDTPGTVSVYIRSSTEVDGVPTPAQLSAAFNTINYDEDGNANRRPVGALVSTKPIVRTPFSVRVLGLSVDNPIAVRASIEEALEAYFLEREPFLVGLSSPPRMDRITASAVSGVIDDIVRDASGIFDSAVLYRDEEELTAYTLVEGELAKLDEVAYV